MMGCGGGTRVEALERDLGIDLDGDGDVGEYGSYNQDANLDALERDLGMDLDGDGAVGKRGEGGRDRQGVARDVEQGARGSRAPATLGGSPRSMWSERAGGGANGLPLRKAGLGNQAAPGPGADVPGRASRNGRDPPPNGRAPHSLRGVALATAASRVSRPPPAETIQFV